MMQAAEQKIWPNHHSQPIWGTKYYRWVLWIDGDVEVLGTIHRVRYILHPTFNKPEIETDYAADNFRIDGRGWGSFYVRIIVYYEGGFSEELSYFLDIKQFFRRKGRPQLKRCSESSIDDKRLISLYQDGYRVFSGILITPTEGAILSQKNLIGADFMGSNLAGLQMLGTNLAMCNFQNANLTKVNLSGANLTRCRLSFARLDGSVIYGVNKTDWIVDGVKATHVYLDTRRLRRLPYGRDFGEDEFARWLMAIRDLDDLVPPSAPRVFVSYSWQDEEAVLAVDQWLRSHGIDVVIDRRNFIPGSDLYEEMVESIKSVDKVVVFYSSNSKDRPYTTLERRMAQEVELRMREKDNKKILLIYFQLDDEQLPTEVSHRLSIRSQGRSFLDACQSLLDAIMEQKSQPTTIDLNRYRDHPPW